MDPVTCYDQMVAALCEGDRQAVGDRAESLVQWIERGGFIPPALMTRFETRWRVCSYLSDVVALCLME